MRFYKKTYQQKTWKKKKALPAPLLALAPELDALDAKHPANPAARAAALEALLAAPRAFTQGLPLGDWLDFLPWADPITGAALLAPPGVLLAGSDFASTTTTPPHLGWVDGASAAGEVTGGNLRGFLAQLADLWLGRGVARQAAAFRRGLGDMASLDAGVLAFEPAELRDLRAGPGRVEWTDESLKKILRPKGDFVLSAASGGSRGSGAGGGSSSAASASPLRRRTASSGSGSNSGATSGAGGGGSSGSAGGGGASGGGVDTLEWLRQELVLLAQPDRLRFLELTTGVRCLTPDKVITVRRTDQRWPFFHSCTNQREFRTAHLSCGEGENLKKGEGVR